MTKISLKNVVGVDLLSVLPPDRKQWWETPHLIKLNGFIVGLLLFSSTVGYDSSLMNGLQSLSPWTSFMDSPSGAWLGFISAIQSLGSMLGLPTQAWAANKFGRKPCIFVGYLFLFIGVGIQVGAHNPAMFIVSRFFIGYAGAWFQAAVILLTEIAYPTHRSKLTAMYQCQYYVGSILSAWLVFGCRNMDSMWAWKIPSLCQIAFPLVALPLVALCPESPRWLISMDRHEEARSFLVRYHAGGDVAAPLVAFQMDEIARSITMERESSNSTTWLDMLRTKGNRHRLFISLTLGIFAQWNGMQVWNLVMAVVGSMLVDFAGRRTLFLLSTCIMLVSYIIITGLSGTFANNHVSSVGTAVIPFLFLYYGGYDIAFTPLVMAYPAEIWPYALRAKGVALTSVSTFLALLFNQFVNPIALDSIAWKYYILYICLLVVILVTIYLTYPETRGYSLEEIAVIFDGDDAAVIATTGLRKEAEANKRETEHLESFAKIS
ncbi:hypothetical protein N7510_006470 [Penicillium lagena]|uniref:uncharacterized protein n=1 Tax=Penicillium lagena TaxID=94218 RepID=UPI002541AED7|nr:uncharacterized protein N7510_006470 [Penicillium lagena]KAJ5613276.1 hypothetical protein N7510_006470 [Penicillium lagena]